MKVVPASNLKIDRKYAGNTLLHNLLFDFDWELAKKTEHMYSHR
jgi:hypothetical protein